MAPSLAGLPGDALFNCFAIGCPCGNRQVTVLGYWRTSDIGGEAVFVGPLAIRCPECAATYELIDPAKDGYNGEMGDSSTLRGTGSPSAWRCPVCEDTQGALVASFGYQFEPDDGEHGHWHDFFDTFILTHLCNKDQRPIEITIFECA
jgi:hypothetical protein